MSFLSFIEFIEVSIHIIRTLLQNKPKENKIVAFP